MQHYEPSDELIHYGVRGMKWGVRKKRQPAVTNAYRSRIAGANQDYRNAKQQAKAQYKAQVQAARNTPEAKAARAKKAKRLAVAGAAVAATALATYGAYKMNKYVKSTHCKIQAERGYKHANEMWKMNLDYERNRALLPGSTRQVSIVSNSGYKALDSARDASKDSFRTALSNIRDYKKSGGNVKSLRNLDYYRINPSGNSITFTKRR